MVGEVGLDDPFTTIQNQMRKPKVVQLSGCNAGRYLDIGDSTAVGVA
jgi:hypothetical protein